MGTNTQAKNRHGEGANPGPRRKPGRVRTSCAECRRLKLRCDRNVPCGKCTSRGCGTICPNGLLQSGRNNRMDMEELHERVKLLSARVKELEEALSTLQASITDIPHPLLRSERITGNRNSSNPESSSSASSAILQNVESGAEKIEDTMADAFGTLAISNHGYTSFLGKTARTEYLIQALSKPQELQDRSTYGLSRQIVEKCSDTITGDDNLRREIFSKLPHFSEARQLCELYIEYGTVMFEFGAMPRKQLYDEVLEPIYSANSFSAINCEHSLSLLYIVFALGALFDPARPAYSNSAHEFYLLGRAALSILPPMRMATLDAVQASIHIAEYLDLSEKDGIGSAPAWIYVGFSTRLAHTIGLHLNSARWNLQDSCVQRRSRVFWQLFQLDTWISFGFGRPPANSKAFLDCPLPTSEDQVVTEAGTEISFHSWNWRYASLMHSILSAAFGCQVPAYSTISELDSKIRNFPVPSHLQTSGPEDETIPPSPTLEMRRWFIMSHKEIALLHLHRSYFSQALSEAPHDLIESKFGPSVVATSQSARRLIEILEIFWRKIPGLMARTSLAWSQVLSAAISMCLIVTKAPTSSLAMSALEDLAAVERLFETAAPTCRAASGNLESVRKLRNKAAYNFGSQMAEEGLSQTELDRLSGKTHLISEGAQDVHVGPTRMYTPENFIDGLQSQGINGTLPPAGQEAFAEHMRVFEGLSGPDPRSFDVPMGDIQSSAAPQVPTGPFLRNYGVFPTMPVVGFDQQHGGLDTSWNNYLEQLGF